MGVEVAGKVFRVGDGEAVLTEQILQGARQDAFARAFDAAQHDGDFALLGGVLHDVGHPVHQVIEVFGIAVADDGADVFLEQLP